MNGTEAAPGWVPDGCPPDTWHSIAREQYLQDLGIRGIGSSDTREFDHAVDKLRGHLDGARKAGRRAGFGLGVIVGAVLVGVLGGILLAAIQRFM